MLGTALPDLKGALCGEFCDSRDACISVVLSIDSQQRQWPENGQVRASGIKAALNAPIADHNGGGTPINSDPPVVGRGTWPASRETDKKNTEMLISGGAKQGGHRLFYTVATVVKLS